MTRGAFHPGFEDLPRVIPVFPLTGVLLLPGGKLPLNIFEPRYLAMVRDTLADEQRMIGMVQPQEAESRGSKPQPYKVGCAGRITSFSELAPVPEMLALRRRLHLAADPLPRGALKVEAQEDLLGLASCRRLRLQHDLARAERAQLTLADRLRGAGRRELEVDRGAGKVGGILSESQSGSGTMESGRLW